MERKVLTTFILVYLCTLYYIEKRYYLSNFKIDRFIILIVICIHFILLITIYVDWYYATYRFVHKLLIFAIFIQVFNVGLTCNILYMIYLLILRCMWRVFNDRCPYKIWYHKTPAKIQVKTRNQWSVLFLFTIIKIILIVSLQYEYDKTEQF